VTLPTVPIARLDYTSPPALASWLSYALSLVTLLFHRDLHLDGYVPAAALGVSALATFGFFAEALLKRNGGLPKTVQAAVVDVEQLAPAIKQAVTEALAVKQALPRKATTAAVAKAPVVTVPSVAPAATPGVATL
jgi:hypothetical protein